MTGDPTLAEMITRLYGTALVEAEVAYWDQKPKKDLRGSYYCRNCQQRVRKDDLAAIFHHRQRGHEPLPKAREELAPSLSEQLTQAFDQALRAH